MSALLFDYFNWLYASNILELLIDDFNMEKTTLNNVLIFTLKCNSKNFLR